METVDLHEPDMQQIDCQGCEIFAYTTEPQAWLADHESRCPQRMMQKGIELLEELVQLVRKIEARL